MSERYQIDFDGYIYWVIDTTVDDDGETPCNVAGAFSRAEAEAKCSELNAKEAAV